MGPGISANARRPDRPGNEFPGSSIGMSLRDSAPFADATSVLRLYDVSVPEGDIPMVEPGNSFPGRPWRRDAAGILDRPAIHIRFANGITEVAGALLGRATRPRPAQFRVVLSTGLISPSSCWKSLHTIRRLVAATVAYTIPHPASAAKTASTSAPACHTRAAGRESLSQRSG